MRLEIPPIYIPSGNRARIALLALAGAAFLCAGAPTPAEARRRHPAKEQAAKGKTEDAKAPADAPTDKKSGKKQDQKNQKDAAKPDQIGTFGDWGAFATHGKEKTCYALASPKERQPKAKPKDPSAYVFVSTRPGEGVRNEVAINLGYQTKDGSAASADIDGDVYELVTKGTNAWVKNAAEEPKFVKALKEGGKLTIKASSAKGKTTTDAYSLEGLSKALDRVQQECR